MAVNNCKPSNQFLFFFFFKYMFSIYTCTPVFLRLAHFEDKIARLPALWTLKESDRLQFLSHSTILKSVLYCSRHH